MVFRGGTFGRSIGRGGGALRNGTSAFIGRGHRAPRFLCLPGEGGQKERLGICNPEEGPHQRVTVLPP